MVPGALPGMIQGQSLGDAAPLAHENAPRSGKGIGPKELSTRQRRKKQRQKQGNKRADEHMKRELKVEKQCCELDRGIVSEVGEAS